MGRGAHTPPNLILRLLPKGWGGGLGVLITTLYNLPITNLIKIEAFLPIYTTVNNFHFPDVQDENKQTKANAGLQRDQKTPGESPSSTLHPSSCQKAVVKAL